MTEKQNKDKIHKIDPPHKAETVSGRRALLASIAGGTVTGLLPTKWISPVVKSVMLPAHAITSSAFTISCVATPPSGSSVPFGNDVSVIVTVTPNPGAGQPGTAEGLCDGLAGGFPLTARTTDANGQWMDGPGALTFCDVGQVACIRYTFGGASVECCWTVTLPPRIPPQQIP